MSEDGELSDGSFDGNAETKRRRTNSGDRHTPRRNQRYESVVEEWRRCMRDDEQSDQAYKDRLHRSGLRQRSISQGSANEADRESSVAGSLRSEELQAMSTKRQDPNRRNHDTKYGRQRQHEMTNRPSGSQNASMFSQQKMFKVESFPKGVKPTEQLHEWTFWLANFEMASEKAGVFDQRAKAIDLSLHIGEDVRRIIIGKEMMPPEKAVSSNFPFYDNVVRLLDEHFRGLTDESVDVTVFNTLKQGEKETAIEFEFRLKQVARRVNETNPAMIRTRYIDGLRDKDLRERAFIDGISLSDAVKMATRKEAIASKQQEFSPWGGQPITVAAIAQVNQRQGWNDSHSHASRPHDSRSRDSRYQPSRSTDFKRGNAGHGYGGKAPSKCPNCGVVEHKFGTCPAERATCFECNKIGHFKHMCTKRVLSLNNEPSSEEKVRD